MIQKQHSEGAPEDPPQVQINKPRSPGATIERQRLIDRHIALRLEIQGIFNDCAHWNEHVRQPHEAPIDPDPDGQLRKVADDIDAMLKREVQ
jgi:hypothetical protein